MFASRLNKRGNIICQKWIAVAALIVLPLGCSRQAHHDLDYDHQVAQTWYVDEIPAEPVVQFESVFWEPDDTTSLRDMITAEGVAEACNVLEIGTGTGLLAILCGLNNAKSVVATDINPAAVANAKYNAASLAEDYDIEVRLVPKDRPGAFEVIKADEVFDLIISNPPWEDGSIAKPADHALYDPSFALMDSLLDGLPKHLRPGGRCLLAYGHVPAIVRLKEQAADRGFKVSVLDDRKLEDLAKDFLPGMVIELRLPHSSYTPPATPKKDATATGETEFL